MGVSVAAAMIRLGIALFKLIGGRWEWARKKHSQPVICLGLEPMIKVFLVYILITWIGAGCTAPDSELPKKESLAANLKKPIVSVRDIEHCILIRHRQHIVNVLKPRINDQLEVAELPFDSGADDGDGYYFIFRKGTFCALYVVDLAEGVGWFTNYGCAKFHENGIEINPDINGSLLCESNGGMYTLNRMKSVINEAVQRGVWRKVTWMKERLPQIQFFEKICG